MTADRDPIDVGALRAAVAPAGWRRVDVVDETGSTNADLIARAASGEDIAGAVLIAEHQTAGRGRNGRTWTAVPRAQLTVSAAVDTTGVPAEAWGWIPLLTGLAVVDAVAEVAGVRSGVKWPNDVLAGPQAGKLAGILAEVASPQSIVVVGLGLNVSLAADELPTAEATSLGLLGAETVDRTALAAALLRALSAGVAPLASGVDDALVARYTAASLTIGLTVRATLPGDRAIVGQAVGVDDQGRLRIEADGETVTVSAGDIVHLRPVF
jgi:BirA family biotin operon repressor/biotin-[acetyl-CoA-carboxylase] ligase